MTMDGTRTNTPGQKQTTPGPAGNSALKAVCVYCGSGPGVNPRYATAARILGRELALRQIRLIYGGGGLGLMGSLAQSVIDHGGKVTGIIPEFLRAKEHALAAVEDMVVVPDMHTRKRMMFEHSDAFVALPGGIGTLEELVEQLTWAQLGRHSKPIILANIDGFWTPFLDLLAHMKTESFIRAGLDVKFTIVDKPEQIISAAEGTFSDPSAMPEGASIALF